MKTNTSDIDKFIKSNKQNINNFITKSKKQNSNIKYVKDIP